MAKDRTEYHRQWRAKNREKMREYQRQWRAAHPDSVKESARKRAAKTREYHREYYEENRERIREKHKAHYYANHSYWREKHRGYRRTAVLKQYGLTVTQYEEMAASQNGVCGICERPERPRKGKPVRLAVDHDHSTGKVRGLLCRRCNRGIGSFEHDTGLLTRAGDYLARTGG